MSHVRFGFAAGCEAVAMPRQQKDILFPGYAPGSGLALQIYWAKGHTRGKVQNVKASLRRGVAIASHPAAKPELHQGRTFMSKLKGPATQVERLLQLNANLVFAVASLRAERRVGFRSGESPYANHPDQ